MMNMGEFPIMIKQENLLDLVLKISGTKTGIVTTKDVGTVLFMLEAFGMSERAIACTFDYILVNNYDLYYIMWNDNMYTQKVEVVD